MFCPSCESEYREGIARCADCDCDLVAQLGEEEVSAIDSTLIPLADERSFGLVSDIVDRLEKAGVPYVIEAGTALSLLANPSIELREPDDWEARIYVASAFMDRAVRILDQVRAGLDEEEPE